MATDRTTAVFAYGSLLDPRSLRRTLPDVDLGACVPARCAGYRRTFTVAYPNDGSQGDKAYLRPDGTRPQVVLFCDLTVDLAASANGVCIPVDDRQFELLVARERRYHAVDVRPAMTYPYGRRCGRIHRQQAVHAPGSGRAWRRP